MRRRKQENKKLVTYTLSTDQGSPDVYVDGVKVGTAFNGSLTWQAKEYSTNKTVTLENITVNAPHNGSWFTYIVYDSSLSPGRQTGSSIRTTYGNKVTISNFAIGRRYNKVTYTGVKTGTLIKGSTSITINQSRSSVRGELEEEQSATYAYHTFSSTWNSGYVSASPNSVTVQLPDDQTSSVTIRFDYQTGLNVSIGGYP